MVRGIGKFKEWFKDYSEQYVIIGGTACDLLMSEEGLDFRATKDFDLVLIVEAIDKNFGYRFWEFVITAGYEHCNKSVGKPEFYRFYKPRSKEYPIMIELFSRRLSSIELPENAILSPIPLEEDLSSLSAILLDDDYYEFMKHGRIKIDGVTVLEPEYLIPFKAKAWLDLSEKKARGERVDSKNIRKHKNDVFRLTEALSKHTTPPEYLPEKIKIDMQAFVKAMCSEEITLKELGIREKTKEEILKELQALYK